MSRFEKKLQQRKKKYLRTSDRESSVLRRESLAYSISKNKREKNLLKKRMLPQPTSTIPISINLSEWEKIPLPDPVELFKYKKIFQKGAKMEIYKHLFLIRKLVSQGTKHSCTMVFASGIIEELSDYLGEFDDPYLQMESVRILGHIAELNQPSIRILYEYELIPKYVTLLSTKRTEIFEHVIWTLSSMANYKDLYRESILDQKGLFDSIFQVLKFENPPISLLQHFTFLLFNLSQTLDQKHIKLLKSSFEYFVQAIFSEIADIVKCSCLGLGTITTNFKDFSKALAKQKIIKQFVSFLESDDLEFQIPALRCIGNIVSISENEIGIIIDEGAIALLIQLFKRGNSLIEEEICWILSNLCISSKEIQLLFDQNILSLIVKRIEKCGFGTVKNIMCIITNFCINGNDDQMNELLSYEIIKLLLKNCKNDDIDLIMICLRGLKALLIYGDSYDEGKFSVKLNFIANRIRRISGDEILLKLCYHTSRKISELARLIYEKYLHLDNFNIEYEENEENEENEIKLDF
ncbi:importin subunit alpha-4 [Anaeramoeba flamelloides]|uniref:Importin subunit alpha-4 n=1 Tax=Anaeramoeba flamelloides TaxID=1746091 RepID=A0AAV7Y617_9EUKA|nr:importin subunit alpha-4 [Anaeramoeba flamelloides]